MSSKLTNYQCPSCTGPLRYDTSTGRLQCDYCGSSFTTAEIEKILQDKLEEAEHAALDTVAQQTAAANNSSWTAESGEWNPEAEGMRLYQCPSCGAELVCDMTTAATRCPYCGNPTVIPAQFHGKLRPDYILPFKVSREQAIAELKKYYKGKPLLPKRFSEENHLEEVRGVYVPFWLFSGTACADMSYSASNIHIARLGNEEVTTTEYYELRRTGTVEFSCIPADGSKKMPDDLMDSIEPFHYSELRTFSTAYMPGFLADVYDVEADTCYSHVEERAYRTTQQLIDSTVGGYTTIAPKSRSITLNKRKVSYALLPIWILSTRWGGRNYLFAMNGQTGKFTGDLPVSMGRFFAWFAGISLPLMGLLALLLRL